MIISIFSVMLPDIFIPYNLMVPFAPGIIQYFNDNRIMY
jgi:hypothetical protein